VTRSTSKKENSAIDLRSKYVFSCLAIKAIHLEVVSDLISEGFLAALCRFVARSGIPEHMHSDNGTNFVGANNEIKRIICLTEFRRS